ncbi:hypothetical protein [Deinococcus cellulosilyticus]|uniref:Periplasmic heavy metal sensor n=1 Tax=Deinococcus cellulosilyticus (strain DSM 18568 / NBRC 106333 / KACC 11606 / 5516J-15) TaxID=1223518 RepID=A0A511N1K2_DEIC1|nr:hypothetical protein [Deinococcus cellulosilyticus]GEM46348.1 hypothetical protein DC3_19830 [Deinococcus cellulosilyticus NBRC 106333 = KACC 11606]
MKTAFSQNKWLRILCFSALLSLTPALAQGPVRIAIPAGQAAGLEEDMKLLKAYQPVMEFVPVILTLKEEIQKGRIKLSDKQKTGLIGLLETLRTTENLTVEKTGQLKKQLETKILTAKQLMQLDTAILRKRPAMPQGAGDGVIMVSGGVGTAGGMPENPAEKLKRGDPFSPFQNPETLRELQAFIQDLKRN